MSKSFSAAVGSWASQSKQRISAVHRRSVELLGDEMSKTRPQGGRVPFQTGNLARSILASTSGMPRTAEGPFAGSNVGLIAARLRPDQKVWLGYQAAYARRVNNGFVGADRLGRVYNQQGAYFVEGAIMSWPQIVAKAVAELRR